MNFNYNVPIISSNLRREETIVQIADTLHYLSEVANDIFRRINDRIELNSRKLLTVKKRIKDVDYQVVKLAGEKKAVQVYSSCKYPAAHLNPKYNVIFCCENKLQPKRTQYKYSETVITKEEPPDRLEYYHVKTKTLSYYNTEDLDKIPENLEFFTDVLLYNTGKNLFKDYLILDPLETNLIPNENYQFNGSKIEDAPVSITHLKVITPNDDDSYFYSPNLGEVPMLEVPLDLPDLPGVANDLKYETAESFGIAPSSGICSPVDIKIIANSKDTNANSVENIEVVDKKTNKIVTEKVLLQSTTKIEKLNEVENLESKTNVTEACNKVSLPENPTEVNKIGKDYICLNEKSITGNSKNKEKIDLFLTNSTAHTTLMEAIRKAGGVKNANLKNTTSKKLETGSVSGGDLMADLHAKLSLRRKGISGVKSNNNCIDVISTFARISDLIPLPPPSSGNEEENDATEDDEWDD